MKMRLTYPSYPDLEILPKDKRAWALWYYYTLAQQLHEKLGKGIDDQFGLLETDLWMDPQYERIARSVAIVYGFSDPGEFMKEGLWECVIQQAIELDLPNPRGRDYTRPLRIVIH